MNLQSASFLHFFQADCLCSKAVLGSTLRQIVYINIESKDRCPKSPGTPFAELIHIASLDATISAIQRNSTAPQGSILAQVAVSATILVPLVYYFFFFFFFFFPSFLFIHFLLICNY
jgi:hypothetical protein